MGSVIAAWSLQKYLRTIYQFPITSLGSSFAAQQFSHFNYCTLIRMFRSMAHLGLADDGFISIPHTNNRHTTTFTPATTLNQPDDWA